MVKSLSFEDQWARIDKSDTHDCWLWQGATNGSGRALFKDKSASREVFRRFIGNITKDENVCHSCDNPRCVNPRHLWLGTQKENMRDCANKGRRSKNSRQKPGEQHSLAKLKDNDIRKIRNLYGRGCYSYTDIAAIWNISPSQVGRIIKFQRWKHIIT